MKNSLLLCICMLACFVPANANLILNPSFELPVVGTAPPAFASYPVPPGTGITDWMVVGAPGTEVSLVNGTYSKECCTFAPDPSDGAQWLDLTGFSSNQFEGVQQTVTTTIGTTYDLSFLIGNVYDPGGVFGTTSTVQVRLGGIAGAVLGNFTNSSTTPGVITWMPFATTFVATAGSTTLDFLNLDPVTDNSNGLDSLVLTAEAAPGIPEPGTLSLLGMGIIGLGLTRRLAKRSFHLPTR